MPTLFSQRLYAEYRGVTHGAVQKAIRVGRIVTERDGRIRPDEGVRHAEREHAPVRLPAKHRGP